MVKPMDIYKQLCKEFPRGSFLLEHGAEEVQFGKGCTREMIERGEELRILADIFNANCPRLFGNKRNWLKRVSR
jgi:hypothetical protein